MNYPKLLRAISNTPWAIDPEKGRAILDMLAFRTAGGQFSRAEINERIGQNDAGVAAATVRPESGSAPAGGNIAVIGIHGVIDHRAGMMTDMSGMTSTERVSALFREAVADDTVSKIVFDVDSPGGNVFGVEELADLIDDARGIKPMTAVANATAASAAYWIASQADEIVLTPSGEVGSIGVWTAHEEYSKMMEEGGVGVELVSAGQYKTEGNPFEPLSDDARGYMKRRVDQYYESFVSAVARGRSVSIDEVKGGFGQGRVVGAQDALAAGMVDRIESLDDALRRLSRPPARQRSSARVHAARLAFS